MSYCCYSPCYTLCCSPCYRRVTRSRSYSIPCTLCCNYSTCSTRYYPSCCSYSYCCSPCC